jgi:isopentenyl diphosphate isomerase/L-lactate dehydrogenase-like FMN-dependent dehydrogenase
VPSFDMKLAWRPPPVSVEDYRRLARRKLPDMVWAYVDGGADDLVTLRANRSAFDRYSLRARVLTGNEGSDLATTVCGANVSLPIAIAPTGMTGMSHWRGEVAIAQAAERAGTRAVLSTAASYTPEEVAAATAENHFFQLYPWAQLEAGARDLTRTFIDRARRSGFTALVVTVDVPVRGNREGERRYGMAIPPEFTPARMANAVRKPRWVYHFLKDQRTGSRLLVDKPGTAAAVRAARLQYRMTHPELNWDDFSWMRDQWDGPLVIKGVLDAADAELAVARGADGVIVSNHGGRQLDSAMSSLAALPAIVKQVGGRAPVYLDGGVRRGTDVIKALCLGATAVFIGRPAVYGLAARGSEGAEEVIEILRAELTRAMTLMGVSSIRDLDQSCLIPNGDPVPARCRHRNGELT